MSDKIKFKETFGEKRLYAESQSGIEWSIPLFELAYEMAVIRTRNRGGSIEDRLKGLQELYAFPEDAGDHLVGSFNWSDFSHWVEFHSGSEFGIDEEWMESDFFFKK